MTQDTHVIFRPELVLHLDEVHIDLPADIFPIHADAAKLQRLGAFPAIRGADSNGKDVSVEEGKNYISGRNLAHTLIEWVAPVAGGALRRPEVGVTSCTGSSVFCFSQWRCAFRHSHGLAVITPRPPRRKPHRPTVRRLFT